MRTTTFVSLSAAVMLSVLQFGSLGAILGNSLGHVIRAQSEARTTHVQLLQKAYGTAETELRVSQK